MKSEPILSKIQRILRIESRPAFPPAFASLRRAKQKNFLYIFLSSAPQNFFQLRKLKFFCFVFLLREELRKRFHPTARLLGQSLSRIIPKGFVRGPQIFFGGGKILKQKGWWMGLER